MLIFQYPRTDRTGCNCASLSHCRDGARPFQYPRTDRTGCNPPNSQFPIWLSVFQYPRTDRTGCNQIHRPTVPQAGSDFQYPRTDRTGCNPVPEAPSFQPLFLSVSSDGSNGMQLFLLGLHLPRPVPLSVSSDGSNGMQLRQTYEIVSFYQAFSILGRIERDATANLRHARVASCVFQYPRTDRTGCNPAIVFHSPHCPPLSVSSDGSNGMQLLRPRWSRPRRLLLSVSSDGSNGMQHRLREINNPITSDFQYPRTDRTGCNGFGTPGC